MVVGVLDMFCGRCYEMLCSCSSEMLSRGCQDVSLWSDVLERLTGRFRQIFTSITSAISGSTFKLSFYHLTILCGGASTFCQLKLSQALKLYHA